MPNGCEISVTVQEGLKHVIIVEYNLSFSILGAVFQLSLRPDEVHSSG